jgi:plasmid stabilization system protein ParE
VSVRYIQPALADLDGILSYIAARSPRGARRVQQRLRNVIELLTLHPHIGRRTSDPAIRRLVVSPYPYLVFYETTGDETSSMPFDMRHVTLPACRVLNDHD